MNLIDSASEYLNRGISSAGRGTKTITLKARLADLDRKGDELYAQLGRKAVDMLRENEGFYGNNRGLFDSVDEYERQRRSVEDELDRLKALAELTSAQSNTVVCPKCGRQNAGGNNFCVGCGAKLDKPQPGQQEMRFCPACGAPVRPGASFCSACGSSTDRSPDSNDAELPSESDLRGFDGAATQPAMAASPSSEGLACPSCGFMNAPGAGFCRMCGGKLA